MKWFWEHSSLLLFVLFLLNAQFLGGSYVNFEQTLNIPSSKYVLPTQNTQPSEWYQIWMFIVFNIEGTNEYKTNFRSYYQMPGESKGYLSGFYSTLDQRHLCVPSVTTEDSKPATYIENLTSQNVTFISFGYEFTVEENGEMKMNDSEAVLDAQITPFGESFYFSYYDTLSNSTSTYLQTLGSVSGYVNGSKITGFGGIERYVGEYDWGNAAPFSEIWYSDWLLFVDTPEGGFTSNVTYGLLISPTEGVNNDFGGGYVAHTDGVESSLLNQPPIPEEIYRSDQKCKRLPTAIQYSTALDSMLINATQQVIAYPGFSWMAITPVDDVSTWGWWEHHQSTYF